jgi:hypothetical protein
MGSKVGFVGPVRGFGKPRFILETPLLATIANVLVGDEASLPFKAFVVRAREQLGLVLGDPDMESLPPAVLSAFPSEAMARQQLGRLEGRLRHRMVQSGLAREFSDAHTRVYAR